MAELFGKITGCSKGKGGSMHMWSNELGILGGNGIVAAQMPIAAGVALAAQYLGEDSVTACFFGDGAVDEGAFHESLNLASIWKLPVVYVCENNQYSMGMAVHKAWAVDSLIPRAAAYNMPGEQVDGMDVVAVHEAALEAAEHARAGQGPIIVEMLTYRYRGHSMSDPAKYRTKDEVNRMRTEHDPIDHLRQRLLDEYSAREDELKQIEKRARDIVIEAAQFAQDCPEPDPSELWTDVLAEA